MIRQLAALSDRLNSEEGGLVKGKVPPAMVEDLQKMSQLLAQLQENICTFKLPEKP